MPNRDQHETQEAFSGCGHFEVRERKLGNKLLQSKDASLDLSPLAKFPSTISKGRACLIRAFFSRD